MIKPYAKIRTKAAKPRYIIYLTIVIITSPWWDFGFAVLTSSAVLPKYVFAPVLTTAHLASPRLTMELE
jgi:hypothetical protein